MTKVAYVIEDSELNGNVFNPVFLLTNKAGGYASLGNFPISKFQGVFFNERFRMYKAIENIIPLDCPEISKVEDKFFAIERERGHIKEEFFMPMNKNALVYSLSEEKEIEIDMDAKESYDMREFGRFYNLYAEDGKTIIEFTKRTDRKEDATEGHYEYSVFVVVNCTSFEKIERWYSVHYSFDQERNAAPFDRHVYRAVRFKAKELILTFSRNKNTAISENDEVSKNLERLKTEYELRARGFKRKAKDEEVDMAYKCASMSIDSLLNEINSTKGIYAGLYWFFQFWLRDEAISLRALMRQKKYDEVKEILMREINHIESDGTVHSMYPKAGLRSADSAGWIFRRAAEFIETLQKERKLHDYLTEQDIKFIKEKLEQCVFSLLKKHTFNDIVINEKNETWMDTGYESDTRAGARIEIQALRLCMYRLLKELSKRVNDNIGYKMAEHLEESLRDKTRSLFWNGSYLRDGADDSRIRPNVFIAYYVYPELLSKSEWVKCFRTVIPKLWNEWGGLATIDKHDSLFCNYHTGQDNRSYHRGDSWYWLNNLAALCMARLSRLKFRGYISKILRASTKEILWSGIVGHHAEISSSAAPESKGCLAQAWSSAMYIELVDEMFR